LIKKNVLAKVAKRWKHGANLMALLDNIAGEQFQQRTRFYRNKAQHRIPPCLEFGQSNFLTRNQEKDGKVSYTFGYADAITTEEAIPILICEWGSMQGAFEAYWDLVSEHTAVIKERAEKISRRI